MLYRAEAIRGIRMQSIINEQFYFLDHHKMKQDFLFYFKKMCKKKDEKWDVVYKFFHNLVQGTLHIGDITVKLRQDCREYLLKANKLRLKGKISINSASGYYSTFRGLLKIAYIDKVIKENVNDFLDKIEPQEVKKSTSLLTNWSVWLVHLVTTKSLSMRHYLLSISYSTPQKAMDSLGITNQKMQRCSFLVQAP